MPRRVCLIRDLTQETCNGEEVHGAHHHISLRDAYILAREGALEWIVEPQRRRDPGVARWCRKFVIRGMSAKYGEALALAVRQEQDWALTMIGQIQRGRPALGPGQDSHAS